jgi:hypothetical protein
MMTSSPSQAFLISCDRLVFASWTVWYFMLAKIIS